jgi:hypothetical protein
MSELAIYKVSIVRVGELAKIGVLWPNVRIIARCTFGSGRGTGRFRRTDAVICAPPVGRRLDPGERLGVDYSRETLENSRQKVDMDASAFYKSLIIGAPYGIRTRVTALRGRRIPIRLFVSPSSFFLISPP